MTAAADLLELLPPATVGRIETLAGLPVRTIGERLDDRIATVATLTVVLAQLTDADLEEAAGRYRTVVALRRAVDGAVMSSAQAVIEEIRAAHAAEDASHDPEPDSPPADQEEGGGT